MVLFENPFADKDLGKGCVACWDLMREDSLGRNGDVQHLGLDDDIPYRPNGTCHAARYDLHRDTVRHPNFRDLSCSYISIAGRHHLLTGGKVGPELEAPHGSSRALSGHLLVNNATSRGHPLHITRANYPFVSHAVPVLNESFEEISDGLDPPVWVPGKSGQLLVRVAGVEVDEHEERVEQSYLGKSKGTL